MDNGLRRGRLLRGPADGVEQKMGFLGQSLRLLSADSLRDISREGLVAKLAAPAAFTEFSALDTTNGWGTLALLLLEGRNILLEPKAPEVKSSEELSILEVALGSLGLAATARLRRVTKRPAEGRPTLRKRRRGGWLEQLLRTLSRHSD